MTKEEIALQYYEAARTELNVHLRLRDQALYLYLGAIAALYSIAFGTTLNLEILLVIPFLALGGTLIVTQHDAYIGVLAAYCAKDLGNVLADKGVTQWDNSEVKRAYEKRLVSSRQWGHSLIMLLPAGAALIVNYGHAFSLSLMSITWYLGLIVAIIFSICLLTLQNTGGIYNKRRKEPNWKINSESDVVFWRISLVR